LAAAKDFARVSMETTNEIETATCNLQFASVLWNSSLVLADRYDVANLKSAAIAFIKENSDHIRTEVDKV
jgi:hypothetical protein